jgi:hypothetical protein
MLCAVPFELQTPPAAVLFHKLSIVEGASRRAHAIFYKQGTIFKQRID